MTKRNTSESFRALLARIIPSPRGTGGLSASSALRLPARSRSIHRTAYLPRLLVAVPCTCNGCNGEQGEKQKGKRWNGINWHKR
eukprot:1176859-Prorocentrum_minimum.AAC.1